MGKLDVLIQALSPGNNELLEIGKVKRLFKENISRVNASLNQWEIAGHDIMSRPVKLVKGNIIDQAKLAVPYQQKIVNSAVAFLFGKPVRFTEVGADEQSEAFKLFLELRKDMRSYSKDRENATKMMSETESAKLFIPYRGVDSDPYDTTKPAVSLKCMVLAKSLGDLLYTSFDEYGTMIAFGRGYFVEELDGTQTEHFDIYMADRIVLCSNPGGTWQAQEQPNIIGKIPIAYYPQAKTEWHDVQPLINRYEMINSKRADNNDYTADPILLLWGKVISMPGKEETGKVIRLEGQDAKAEYLTPSMAVEMVKDERETLENQIHYFTDTVNLDNDQLKSMGQDSGKALVMRFFPAILKAMSKHGQFEEMIDRENSIIKAFIGNVMKTSLKAQAEKMEIGIEFGNPLPDNVEDLMNILSTAVMGKPIMSQATAVALNPMVDDPKQELANIEAERQLAIKEQQEAMITAEGGNNDEDE